jgi:hypothetical protein
MRSRSIAVALVLVATVGSVAAAQAPQSPAGSRVIELEMSGTGRFLLEGEEVRTLHVTPGEQILFRVDNTSGTDLGFEIGTVDQICDPEQTPRKAIPAWSEGIRELPWQVARGAVHLRWGHRGRHCSLGTFSTGAEASEDRAVDLPRFAGPRHAQLADSESLIRFDADFEETTSAVAWQKLDDPWHRLHLSRSDEIDFQDFATKAVADDVEDWSVAICGSDVVVGYVQHAPGDDRRLWLERRSGGADGVSRIEVRGPLDERSSIDVACSHGRAVVAWRERVAGETHATVRSASLPGLELAAVLDAGPARGRFSVAATDEHVLLAWKDDSRRVRLARFRVDGGHDAGLVRESIETIARRGSGPLIDADDTRVAVGYTRRDVAFVATSRDGGASFDRRERFGSGRLEGTPWEFESLAVHGRDVVAVVFVYYGGDAWDRQRLRSRDLGRGWTHTRIGEPAAAVPRDGLLATPDGVRVAEAYTDGEYADEFDLRVRRER